MRMALAQLEYDHKLSLDDKVAKYIPDFRLYDPVSTQIVSLRDILSHRIGTKTFQGDFTFWNSSLTGEKIIYKMRLLKPSNPFRQTWGYCNSCFLTAGQVIRRVTGKAWEGGYGECADLCAGRRIGFGDPDESGQPVFFCCAASPAIGCVSECSLYEQECVLSEVFPADDDGYVEDDQWLEGAWEGEASVHWLLPVFLHKKAIRDAKEV